MNIKPEVDPIGKALQCYHLHNDPTPVIVHSDGFDSEELPPEYFFRGFDEMPHLERIALKYCEGHVLDIGAGAGCHSLYLQEKEIKTTALEISELCCELMKTRGIKYVENYNIFNFTKGKYDTILLLMNGIGISGTPVGLKKLLIHLKKLLNNNGKILLDSSDLIYLYEDKDGSIAVDLNAQDYYGVVNYRLNYKNFIGEPFKWLFADSVMLSDIAEPLGYNVKIIEYGPHYDYLAELTLA